MYKVILLRHGQSEWNKTNQFTGWQDVALTEEGRKEALLAAESIRKQKCNIEFVFTSYLKRAISTTWIVLEQLDLMWLPVKKSWQLNERHYGNLQGRNKAHAIEKYGEEQVHLWRRGYDNPPPALANKPTLLWDLKEEEIPFAESLKTTMDRVIPYWEQEIVSRFKNDGSCILIVAHHNSLRAMVKHIENLNSEEILNKKDIPTGTPLLYNLDSNFKAIGDVKFL